MPRFVSRADLARLLSVSRAAITKRCQGSWAAACRGDRVNLDHPLIVGALAAKGVPASVADRAPTKSAKPSPKRPTVPTPAPASPPKRSGKPTKGRRETVPLPPQPPGAGSPDDLEALAEYVRPLLERFGTERTMHDWFLMLKNKEVIEGKRLENEATKRLRIPREFVTVHILSVLEETRKRLLTDMPKTLAARLLSLSHSGGTHVEAEREVRAAVSSHLEAVNVKLKKALAEVARRVALKNVGTDGGGGALAR